MMRESQIRQAVIVPMSIIEERRAAKARNRAVWPLTGSFTVE